MYLINQPQFIDQISIKVGPFSLVDAARIHLPPGQTTLEMQHGDTRYRFNLHQDGGAGRYEGAIDTDGTLVLNIYNHVSYAGQGILAPFEVTAYEDGSKLCMTYYVSQPVHLQGVFFEYCLYLWKPVGMLNTPITG